MRARLIGRCPPRDLGYTYGEGPYDAVVIGSLTLGQLLCLRDEGILEALAEGKPVILYVPGLPDVPKNRALAASVASKRRELKNWGVLFVDGTQKRLVTATEAEKMRHTGKRPEPGAVLTPLAREILEGSD